MEVYKIIEVRKMAGGELPPTEMLIEEDRFTIETIKNLVKELILFYTQKSVIETSILNAFLEEGIVIRLPHMEIEVSAANSDLMAMAFMMIENNRILGRTTEEILSLVNGTLGKGQKLAAYRYKF